MDFLLPKMRAQGCGRIFRIQKHERGPADGFLAAKTRNSTLQTWIFTKNRGFYAFQREKALRNGPKAAGATVSEVNIKGRRTTRRHRHTMARHPCTTRGYRCTMQRHRWEPWAHPRTTRRHRCVTRGYRYTTVAHRYKTRGYRCVMAGCRHGMRGHRRTSAGCREVTTASSASASPPPPAARSASRRGQRGIPRAGAHS